MGLPADHQYLLLPLGSLRPRKKQKNKKPDVRIFSSNNSQGGICVSIWSQSFRVRKHWATPELMINLFTECGFNATAVFSPRPPSRSSWSPRCDCRCSPWPCMRSPSRSCKPHQRQMGDERKYSLRPNWMQMRDWLDCGEAADQLMSEEKRSLSRVTWRWLAKHHDSLISFLKFGAFKSGFMPFLIELAVKGSLAQQKVWLPIRFGQVNASCSTSGQQ